MKYLISLFFLVLLSQISISARETKNIAGPDTAYWRVVNQRAAKIVAGINITDTAKIRRVKEIIATQYVDLNKIYSERDAKLKAGKQTIMNKDSLNTFKKQVENEVDASLYHLHFAFIARLQVELDPEQITQVKDGLTYGVVPITYKGYQTMIPELTERQKAQIYAWLVEAREHAMDAESSEKKHGWFGKYKGRINNYLSQQGYDMKKASDEWAKKIREEGAKQ